MSPAAATPSNREIAGGRINRGGYRDVVEGTIRCHRQRGRRRYGTCGHICERQGHLGSRIEPVHGIHLYTIVSGLSFDNGGGRWCYPDCEILGCPRYDRKVGGRGMQYLIWGRAAP